MNRALTVLIVVMSDTLPWDPNNSTYLGCDSFSPQGENAFAYGDPVVDARERAGRSTDVPFGAPQIHYPLERHITTTACASRCTLRAAPPRAMTTTT